MRYHELLADAIKGSERSLGWICNKVHQLGVGLTKSYLSQLQNGKTGPASDDLNKALATVLSKDTEITYQDLRVAAYRERIPDDVFQLLVERHLEQSTGGGRCGNASQD